MSYLLGGKILRLSVTHGRDGTEIELRVRMPGVYRRTLKDDERRALIGGQAEIELTRPRTVDGGAHTTADPAQPRPRIAWPITDEERARFDPDAVAVADDLANGEVVEATGRTTKFQPLAAAMPDDSPTHGQVTDAAGVGDDHGTPPVTGEE